MSGVVSTLGPVVAMVCGGTAAALGVTSRVSRIQRARRRASRLEVPSDNTENSVFTSHPGNHNLIMRYSERMTGRLFTGEVEPITPSVRAGRAGSTRIGARYLERSVVAGCSKEISVSAFCEVRTRLMLAGALAGFLIGFMFSVELALVLSISCALVARALPMRSINGAAKRRMTEAEQHLPEMLEVVALGLRSGLTFDRSFALYGLHFDNGFAHSCTKAYRRWSLGLNTREEALRDLAASYDCSQLSRIVDSIIRSLRLGTALSDILEEAAAQSREVHKAALSERVAKAPVKMMLPTGMLILPAMLLLVLGPILLDLASGF